LSRHSDGVFLLQEIETKAEKGREFDAAGPATVSTGAAVQMSQA